MSERCGVGNMAYGFFLYYDHDVTTFPDSYFIATDKHDQNGKDFEFWLKTSPKTQQLKSNNMSNKPFIYLCFFYFLHYSVMVGSACISEVWKSPSSDIALSLMTPYFLQKALYGLWVLWVFCIHILSIMAFGMATKCQNCQK